MNDIFFSPFSEQKIKFHDPYSSNVRNREKQIFYLEGGWIN